MHAAGCSRGILPRTNPKLGADDQPTVVQRCLVSMVQPNPASISRSMLRVLDAGNVLNSHRESAVMANHGCHAKHADDSDSDTGDSNSDADTSIFSGSYAVSHAYAPSFA